MLKIHKDFIRLTITDGLMEVCLTILWRDAVSAIRNCKCLTMLYEERVLLGIHDMEDYAFAIDGGYIQQFQSIMKMRHNGSIH